MAWTDPGTHVFVVGEVVTAATLNTFLKDNLLDLDRRATVRSNFVQTSESTASNSYVDLATVGPSVTVTTGASGLVLLLITALMTNGTIGGSAAMGWAYAGPSSAPASDASAIALPNVSAGGYGGRFGGHHIASFSPAGTYIITAKYRSVAGGTATFSDRKIAALAIGS